MVEDVRRGAAADEVGAKFHCTIAEMILAVCQRISGETGLHEVALSGGMFQNVTRLGLTVPRLREAGLTVYTHSLWSEWIITRSNQLSNKIMSPRLENILRQRPIFRRVDVEERRPLRIKTRDLAGLYIPHGNSRVEIDNAPATPAQDRFDGREAGAGIECVERLYLAAPTRDDDGVPGRKGGHVTHQRQVEKRHIARGDERKLVLRRQQPGVNARQRPAAWEGVAGQAGVQVRELIRRIRHNDHVVAQRVEQPHGARDERLAAQDELTLVAPHAAARAAGEDRDRKRASRVFLSATKSGTRVTR